jgi:hypothetical protein
MALRCLSSIVCATAFALLSACATPQTQVSDLGSGAYSMTKRSGYLSVRSSELMPQLEQEALAYCRTRGGALVSLDSKTVDPDPPAFAYATIQFRCVAP